MKAIQIQQYGAVDVLEYSDRERPVPDPDECLVKVQAAGVNPVDWKIRQGALRLVLRLDFPFVPGYDICGEVVETGSAVTRFKIGECIYGQLERSGGGYAEYAALNEHSAALRPDRLSSVEAAAMPVAALSALQALRDKGQLRSGQRTLIIGASGGVGHFAVQIAKAMDAEVTAVCGTDNVDWVRDIGADRVIDYRKQDYREEASGYDVIFDAVAVQSFFRCSQLLKPGGIYVSTIPSPGLFLAMLVLPIVSEKRARFIGVEPSGEDLEYLNGLVEEGQLRVVIDRTYPLPEARAAQEQSEKGHARGKIVLEV